MNYLLNFFDISLVLILLWIGWALLSTKDLFKSVVLFIIFGLLMVIAWVRLKAPDIALAEAAIGTGLTGVLLLDAVGHLHPESQKEKPSGRKMFFSGRYMILLPILFLGLVVINSFFSTAIQPQGMTGLVDAQMSVSGVSSKVTAVLLNFRAYDTLLEIAVMLAAVIGVLSIRINDNSTMLPASDKRVFLSAFTHLIVPVAAVVGMYFFYEGTYAAGGAFQAGAVLAASLVLLRLSGLEPLAWLSRRMTELFVFFGFALFLVIGAALVFMGNNLLEYSQQYAGTLIFIIEAGLTLSIAFILAELYSSWSGK